MAQRSARAEAIAGVQKLKLLLLISHLSRLREPRLYECRGSVRAGTVGGPGHREDVPCLGGLESSTEDRRTRSVTTVGSWDRREDIDGR